ncbi:MAG: hypothetical protein ACRD18_03960, partial [Terriglobia bacterium]
MPQSFKGKTLRYLLSPSPAATGSAASPAAPSPSGRGPESQIPSGRPALSLWERGNREAVGEGVGGKQRPYADPKSNMGDAAEF